MFKSKRPQHKTSSKNSDSLDMLVQRCRNGERNAQFELYNLYKDRVYGIAYRMANDSQVAEDLTQKVFIRVFRGIENYRGEAAFSSWLYRITANVCINHFRTANRWKALVTNELTESGVNHVKATRESANKTELAPHLEAAIRTLPEGYRMVFVLHDIEGYNHAEIGGILGIAVGTSKSQLHRARKELRCKLAPVLALHRAL